MKKRLEFYEKPSTDKYLIDQVGDLKKEISSKENIIEELQKSINKILGVIGMDEKILILHNTEPTNLRAKLYEIERNVESQKKEKESEQFTKLEESRQM